MPPQQLAKWKQKTLLRVSLKIIAPAGQYGPTKLVNWGRNRWASSQSWDIQDAGGIGYWMPNSELGSAP